MMKACIFSLRYFTLSNFELKGYVTVPIKKKREEKRNREITTYIVIL